MKVSKPVKILYIIGSLDRGGAEGQLIKLSSNLEPHYWLARVFCLSRPGAQAAMLMNLGVQVDAPKGFDLWQSLFSGKSSFARAIRAFLSSFSLVRIVLGFRPDIIHFILPEAYIAGGLLTIILPVPVRVMSRRSLNLYQRKIPWAGSLERWLHRRMDACIGNSRAVASELIEEGAAASKVKLIPNGLDTHNIRPEPAKRRQRLDQLGLAEPVILCTVIANLIAYKGHLDLVDAVACCRDTLNHPLCVLIIGRDDGMQAAIEERIDSHGIGDVFLFLGSREDTWDWLCASDIAVLASHEEGFSNVILEAMACALPVLATDVGGNSEAVLDTVTGLLVPKQDPRRLGEALATLVNDAGLRADLGRRARERVCECFTLERCVRQHEILYKNLLESAGVA